MTINEINEQIIKHQDEKIVLLEERIKHLEEYIVKVIDIKVEL